GFWRRVGQEDVAETEVLEVRRGREPLFGSGLPSQTAARIPDPVVVESRATGVRGVEKAVGRFVEEVAGEVLDRALGPRRREKPQLVLEERAACTQAHIVDFLGRV